MQRVIVGLFVAVLGGVWCEVAWTAESAADFAARAKKSLTAGDLDAALLAYQAAARGEPDNQEYRQQFSLVRQAQDYQRRMQADRDPERWLYAAWALYTLYLDEEAYPAALRVSRDVHARAPSAASAVMVAEAALKMNDNQAAVAVLAGVEAEQITPATQALRGVALARQGQQAEARKIAAALELPDDAGVTTLFAATRLYALAGDAAKAVAALTKTCAATAPGRLDAFKEQVRQMPDFAQLATTAEFTAALQTQSTVSESKCSGGSSCAGCPNRGKCAGGK